MPAHRVQTMGSHYQHEYFKLTVGYPPHAQLQRDKVNEWRVCSNPNQTYFFLLVVLVYQTLAYKQY